MQLNVKKIWIRKSKMKQKSSGQEGMPLTSENEKATSKVRLLHLIKCSLREISIGHIAWKVSVFGIFLVRIFLHSDKKNSYYVKFSRNGTIVTYLLFTFQYKKIKTGLQYKLFIPNYFFCLRNCRTFAFPPLFCLFFKIMHFQTTHF